MVQLAFLTGIRMSKITNDSLTRSGTGFFYSCTHMATVGIKGLMLFIIFPRFNKLRPS